MNPIAVQMRLSLPKIQDVPASAAVKLRLSAANMRAPFDAVIPVKIAHIKADTRSVVSGLLP